MDVMVAPGGQAIFRCSVGTTAAIQSLSWQQDGSPVLANSGKIAISKISRMVERNFHMVRISECITEGNAWLSS